MILYCVLTAMDMSRKCSICADLLPNDGRIMTCVECKSSYHLGAACSGISDSTFTTMGVAKRDKWRCKACRPSGASVSAVENTFLAQLAAVNEKLDILKSLKENVDSLLQLPAKVDHLLSLKPVVDKLTDTVAAVQTSIEFFSEKYDSLLSQVVANDKVVKALESDVGSLRECVSDQAFTIQRLQTELNDMDQYSRLPNMEIRGLPFHANEDLRKVISDMAMKINLDEYNQTDVLSVHRLPAKRDKTPDVIVRFASANIKEKWMAARGRLRSLSRDGVLPYLFFNDNLTRANRELFWMARAKGKEKMYKFVWVKNGKIFVRKNEGLSLVRIMCVSDLDKLV